MSYSLSVKLHSHSLFLNILDDPLTHHSSHRYLAGKLLSVCTTKNRVAVLLKCDVERTILLCSNYMNFVL